MLVFFAEPKAKYTQLQIAEEILSCAIDNNKPITNLQLNNIMYLIWHDYHQKYDTELFVDDHTENNVIIFPHIYYRWAIWGSSPIKTVNQITKLLKFPDHRFIKKSVEKYTALAPWALNKRVNEYKERYHA